MEKLTLQAGERYYECGGELSEGSQISVDGPADVLRDGLLDSGATPQHMLADLRQRREAEGAP